MYKIVLIGAGSTQFGLGTVGDIFKSKITHTIVNGNIVYDNGIFYEGNKGMRLTFKR